MSVAVVARNLRIVINIIIISIITVNFFSFFSPFFESSKAGANIVNGAGLSFGVLFMIQMSGHSDNQST